MPSCTPELKEFSRRLLALEASLGQPGASSGPAVFRVCQKLRRSIGRLTGNEGYRALLIRALTLAGAEVPWLQKLNVAADGALEGLRDGPNLAESKIAEGEAMLVAQLLGLLVTFIGPVLTRELLREIWPKMDNLNF